MCCIHRKNTAPIILRLALMLIDEIFNLDEHLGNYIMLIMYENRCCNVFFEEVQLNDKIGYVYN